MGGKETDLHAEGRTIHSISNLPLPEFLRTLNGKLTDSIVVDTLTSADLFEEPHILFGSGSYEPKYVFSDGEIRYERLKNVPMDAITYDDALYVAWLGKKSHGPREDRYFLQTHLPQASLLKLASKMNLAKLYFEFSPRYT